MKNVRMGGNRRGERVGAARDGEGSGVISEGGDRGTRAINKNGKSSTLT